MADVITVSTLLDFETGSNGTEVTDSVADAASQGDDWTGWETTDDPNAETPGATPNLTISTSANFSIYTPFAIGGTRYGLPGSRGMRCTSEQNGAIQTTITGGTRTSIGTYIRFNNTGSSQRDLIMLRSSEVAQFVILINGSPPAIQVHQGAGSLFGNSVNITYDEWYYITFKFAFGGQDIECNVYDPSDGYSLVGTSSVTRGGGGTDGVSVVQFGAVKYFEGSGASLTVDYDNFSISPTGTFPLGPGGGPTNWVSATGAATWAASASVTPLSGAACASISTMNSSVGAFEKVRLVAGNYTTQIDPTGTSPTAESERMEITAYNGESVVLSNIVDYAIDLTGFDYVTVDGIHSTECQTYLLLSGSDYNIFQNAHWTNAINASGEWHNGVRITGSSKYWQFIDMTIKDVGDSSMGSDDGGTVTIGSSDSSTDECTFGLFLRCVLARGGHQVVTLYSGYNRFQDCHFYNDPWMDYMGTDYGNRNVLTDGRGTAFNQRNIFDNCTFWRAARPVDATGVASMSLRSPWNIVRRCRFVDGADAGVNINTFSEHTGYSPNGLANSNHVYHNTIVRNGINTGTTDIDFIAGLTLANFSGTTVYTNKIVNNIFWDNVADRSYGDDPDTLVGLNFFAGNREETSDPLFVDWSVADLAPSNPSAHNFNLTASSTSINAGSWLTTITTATGSGTSFVVADSGYFTDGEGIYAGDVIQLQGSSTQLTISDVNYTTHTITFSPSTSWTQGDGVALPYSGSAPDQGAHEFTATGSITATSVTIGTLTVGE